MCLHHKGSPMKFVAFFIFTSLSSLWARADITFLVACSDETPTLAMEVREMIDEPTVVGEVFTFATNLKTETMTLPNYLRFEWPKDKCSKTEAYVMKCQDSQNIQMIDGHQVEPLSVETFSSSERINDKDILYRNILMKILVDGKSIEVQGKFLIKQCTDQMTFSRRPTI